MNEEMKKKIEDKAEELYPINGHIIYAEFDGQQASRRDGFKEGAEYGYNLAKESVNEKMLMAIKRRNDCALSSEQIEEMFKEAELSASNQENNDGWISVEAEPLTKLKEDGSWVIIHEDWHKEMMIAIPVNHDGRWYIKHCFIEDDGALMVVGEDDNEPSGYSITDVTHYKFINPPKSK